MKISYKGNSLDLLQFRRLNVQSVHHIYACHDKSKPTIFTWRCISMHQSRQDVDNQSMLASPSKSSLFRCNQVTCFLWIIFKLLKFKHETGSKGQRLHYFICGKWRRVPNEFQEDELKIIFRCATFVSMFTWKIKIQLLNLSKIYLNGRLTVILEFCSKTL